MSEHLSRRVLLAGLTTLAATPAFADAAKGGGIKSVEAKRLFPFYDRYLAIPAAERTHFGMAYTLRREGGTLEGVQATLVDGGRRTPIRIAPSGRVLTLPTAAQLRSGRVEFNLPENARFGMSLAIEPTARLAEEMSAADLKKAVEQAAAGARRAAGVMGFAVPRLDRIVFAGVGSGQAVSADGRAQALPAQNGGPAFVPASHPQASVLRFPSAPRSAQIGGAPRNRS